MSGEQSPQSRADREARRAVLQDALQDLSDARDPDRAAADVMRALDAYMESNLPAVAGLREPPVTDFDRQGPRDPAVRWASVAVLGGAVVSTIIVAILLAGGWSAGLAIIAIWVVAALVLMST
ncbi:MAG: hypothetical protein MUE51_04355 [Thermoleophilia bacterium]|nr:hypothetical protein [Thermoleophilia bacterium]